MSKPKHYTHRMFGPLLDVQASSYVLQAQWIPHLAKSEQERLTGRSCAALPKSMAGMGYLHRESAKMDFAWQVAIPRDMFIRDVRSSGR